MAETKNRFDLLVFDTAPTGHTMRLLSLPEVMATWTEGMLKRHKKSGHLGKLLETLGGAPKGRRIPLGEDGEGLESRRNARIREILDARQHKFLTPARSCSTETRRHSSWS